MRSEHDSFSNSPNSGSLIKDKILAFPGGSEVEASASNVGNMGSIPGLGRSPGEGNGKLFQYSCLRNLMDKGAWQAIVHKGCKKSWAT